MTNDNTDKADVLHLMRMEVLELKRELENTGTSTESPRTPYGEKRKTTNTTTFSASNISKGESQKDVVGTAVLSGNANSISTITPIESTTTKTKNMLKDERCSNLKAVVDREGKLKYTTQLFDKLPKVYH